MGAWLMGNVGLLFVGAVLFLNGVMLLGWVDAKSAVPLNLFVGALQVVTPTYLIFTAQGDQDIILGASALYLFGFTYLYVALNLVFDLDTTGCGFFCALVVVCALIFSGLNSGRLHDTAFGVIWLNWAFLWLLFFLVLGLKQEALTRYTGAVCAVQGVVTGTIPAFMLLTGEWDQNNNLTAIVLAIFAVVVYIALFPILRERTTDDTTHAVPTGVVVE